MRKKLIIINYLLSMIQVLIMIWPKSTMIELEDYAYFKEHQLYNITMSELLNLSDKPYLVYFFGDGCPACLKSDDYMARFLHYGFYNKIEIYFVDVSINENLCGLENDANNIDRNFKIVYTPTMLYFNNGKFEVSEGYKEVIDKLNEIVKK